LQKIYTVGHRVWLTQRDFLSPAVDAETDSAGAVRNRSGVQMTPQLAAGARKAEVI
jgi:hypothetical protein